jgi:hypothetical protein
MANGLPLRRKVLQIDEEKGGNGGGRNNEKTTLLPYIGRCAGALRHTTVSLSWCCGEPAFLWVEVADIHSYAALAGVSTAVQRFLN